MKISFHICPSQIYPYTILLGQIANEAQAIKAKAIIDECPMLFAQSRETRYPVLNKSDLESLGNDESSTAEDTATPDNAILRRNITLSLLKTNEKSNPLSFSALFQDPDYAAWKRQMIHAFPELEKQFTCAEEEAQKLQDLYFETERGKRIKQVSFYTAKNGEEAPYRQSPETNNRAPRFATQIRPSP